MIKKLGFEARNQFLVGVDCVCTGVPKKTNIFQVVSEFFFHLIIFLWIHRN